MQNTSNSNGDTLQYTSNSNGDTLQYTSNSKVIWGNFVNSL